MSLFIRNNFPKHSVVPAIPEIRDCNWRIGTGQDSASQVTGGHDMGLAFGSSLQQFLERISNPCTTFSHQRSQRPTPTTRCYGIAISVVR
jgi:hypothetical protein